MPFPAMDGNDPRDRSAGLAILAAFGLVLAFEAVATLSGWVGWWHAGHLWDADCYMRLDRVIALHRDGAWYDSFEPRSNAPYGEQLHWTRPLDAVLYAGAWIGSAVTSFRTALWVWGALVSPLLFLIAVGVWVWGARRLAGPGTLVVSVALMLVSPLVNLVYLVGRPDHHSLIELCLTGAVACLLRLLSGDGRDRVAVWAGTWIGLGIWVSVESLAGGGLVAGILALAWVWRGGREARWLMLYCLALSVFLLLVALPIEYPPSAWFAVRYARFTVVDGVLALAGLGPWAVIALWAGHRWGTTRARRLGLALAAAGVTAGAMAVAFPTFFVGPMADFGPRVRAWVPTIGEMRPLWPDRWAVLPMTAMTLGPTVLAVAACLIGLWRGPVFRRPALAALLAGNLAFLPLSLSALRWSAEGGLFAVLPWALAVTAAWRGPGRARAGAMRLLPRVSSALGLALAPLLLAGLLAGTVSAGKREVTAGFCDWGRLAPELWRRWPQGGVALSYIFDGGELIWRTPFAVVGSPYMNEAGLADTEDVLEATDDARAQAILRRRGVAVLLLCRGTHYDDYFQTHAAAAALYNRVMRGDIPPWLVPAPLSPDLGRKFLILEPRLPAAPGP